MLPRFRIASPDFVRTKWATWLISFWRPDLNSELGYLVELLPVPGELATWLISFWRPDLNSELSYLVELLPVPGKLI
ncbi:TPA: hypothetical protein MYP66_004976 [Citrobacter freundii]|nr:hypothetical protein [Citrobacter freundii]